MCLQEWAVPPTDMQACKIFFIGHAIQSCKCNLRGEGTRRFTAEVRMKSRKAGGVTCRTPGGGSGGTTSIWTSCRFCLHAQLWLAGGLLTSTCAPFWAGWNASSKTSCRLSQHRYSSPFQTVMGVDCISTRLISLFLREIPMFNEDYAYSLAFRPIGTIGISWSKRQIPHLCASFGPLPLRTLPQVYSCAV